MVGETTIRILSVDDHPLLCERLAALISNTPGMVLVEEASSAQEGIEQFRKQAPAGCDLDGFALAG